MLSEDEKATDALEHNKAKSRANLAGRPRSSAKAPPFRRALYAPPPRPPSPRPSFAESSPAKPGKVTAPAARASTLQAPTRARRCSDTGSSAGANRSRAGQPRRAASPRPSNGGQQQPPPQKQKRPPMRAAPLADALEMATVEEKVVVAATVRGIRIMSWLWRPRRRPRRWRRWRASAARRRRLREEEAPVSVSDNEEEPPQRRRKWRVRGLPLL